MSIHSISNSLVSPLDQLSPKSTVHAVSAGAPETSPNDAVSGKANRVTDQASLSSASTLLAQALQTPDVRTEKVASLQASIAAGTYHVDSSDVADSLISSLLS
ncbi:flagellar biosynthesis anti-sigma factor FlgM [Granulicella arctica]|uniref:flagellar biosynthesis anti-sigma factor FlgM n=1 Tax=Granulicella arctica TaxID=940613 RepID=UPI0021DFC400|nr:flagellar biosynthesis anti-sigma factor FlgM [Granulicella arctica]